MSDLITERFAICIDHLKRERKIRSVREMASTLAFSPQSLSEILKGNRAVTIKLLRDCALKFSINADFVLTGEGAIFTNEGNKDKLNILNIVTDANNVERISHVPFPAQAGYAAERMNGEFVKKLDTYSLPDTVYSMGTFRSFDVTGDSMEPTFFSRDKVICSFVEDREYVNIKDNYVYVVVTESDILIKRLGNMIRRHNQIELISDNTTYKKYMFHKSEIKELWLVKSFIRHFDHSIPKQSPLMSDLEELSNTFNSALFEKDQQILTLTKTIKKLVDTTSSVP